MNVLIKLSYVGTNYHGFQIQKNGNTVQEELNRAADEVFGFHCYVTGCSRTDSGVHANEFCVLLTDVPVLENLNEFGKPSPIPVSKIPLALNTKLPRDIVVTAAAEVEAGFHPRYDVAYKEYIYKLWMSPIRDPFLEGRAHHYPLKIQEDSLRKMHDFAADYVGTHDFKAFMSAGSDITDTVRTVKYASVDMSAYPLVIFKVAADGFLYNMVRIMTGTLLDMVSGKLKMSIPDIIASGERQNAGFTAPPQGLYLNRVVYHSEMDWQ